MERLVARGERSGEMNSRFIRTHIDLPLLQQRPPPPSQAMSRCKPPPPPRRKKNERRSTGKHLFLKSCERIFLLFFAPQFRRLSGSRGNTGRDEKQSKLLKRGEKVNLNRIWKQQKQQMYCQNTRRRRRKKHVSPVRFLFVHQLCMPTSNI